MIRWLVSLRHLQSTSALQGKNNGTVGMVTYFRCRANYGVFVLAETLQPPYLSTGVSPFSTKTMHGTAEAMDRQEWLHLTPQHPHHKSPVLTSPTRSLNASLNLSGTRVLTPAKTGSRCMYLCV